MQPCDSTNHIERGRTTLRNSQEDRAYLVRRTELSPTCFLLHLHTNTGNGIRAGETLKIRIPSDGQEERSSYFTVLSSSPGGEVAILTRATGRGGAADALSLHMKVGAEAWTSQPFPSVIDQFRNLRGSVLCLVAGSGISMVGGVAEHSLTADADIVFFGKQEDCAAIPAMVIHHVYQGSAPRGPRGIHSWNSTVQGRPTAADIEQMIRREQYSSVIVCGPAAFCEFIWSTCGELGISRQHEDQRWGIAAVRDPNLLPLRQ